MRERQKGSNNAEKERENAERVRECRERKNAERKGERMQNAVREGEGERERERERMCLLFIMQPHVYTCLWLV